MDADSKLCISYLVGDRGAECAQAFAADIADRVDDRIQLTTDSHNVYGDAVDRAFQGDIDYAQIVKVFGKPGTEEHSRNAARGSSEPRWRKLGESPPPPTVTRVRR